MKIKIGTMYTYVDFESDTLLQEKVHSIMHKEMGVKVDGAFYSRAYRAGIWDGITDFYDMKEDKFHTGLLQLFLSGMRKLKESDPTITYTIEDERPRPLLHHDSIDEEIVLGNGDEDPITLRDYQYEAVKKVFEEQVGIVNAATNSGKCLVKDTRVLTDEGYKTIEQIFEESGTTCEVSEKVVPAKDVVLINRYGKPEKASHLTFNGMKSVRKIVTDSGLEEKVTYNHPLLVVTESGDFVWKKAEDIKVGDLLVTRVGDSIFGNDNTVTDEEEAYCLGALIADGYFGQKYKIGFSNDQEILLSTMERYFRTLTSKRIVREKRERSKGTDLVMFDTNAVSNWHNKFNISYGVAKDKRVPQCIMGAPKNIQIAFLSGFLECESAIDVNKVSLELTSASKELLTQVQLLLKNMGVLSTLRQKVVKGYEQNYYGRLNIRSKYAEKLFNLITFKTRQRQEQVEEALINYHNRKHRPFKEAVPNGRQLLEAYGNSVEGLNWKERKMFKGPKTSGVGKDRVRKLLEEFPNGDSNIKAKLEILSSNSLFFDKVVSVEDAGEEPTFDVCMPETHSFIAESIVNHNTEIAAGVIQQVLPYLKKGERVAFITHSKEIMHQSASRIAKRLNMKEKDMGKIGDGKFDIKDKKIVFVMVPTLVSALKDPKKGIKFTHKERVIKFIAEEVAPKFKGTANTRQLLRNYIKNCKLTTKVWESALEHLQYIAYDNRFNDKSAQMQLNKYVVEFEKIMEKKSKNKYKRYKETMEFLESIKVMIADECLVGDTLVLKEDGGWSYIKDVHNGQVIKGGVVSDVFTRESAITSVKSKHTLLEGSPTHPTFVVRKEDIGLYKKGIKQIEDFEQTPLMNIKEGDYIPILVKIPHVEKTQWTPEQLSFVAMIMADGHLDKDSITSDGRVKRSNRVKVNVTKDKEWYLEEFIKGAKSFNPNIEVKHNYDCRGNLTIWTNDKGLKDTLEHVFDIPRGKKSDKIRINEQIQYAPIESIKAFIRTYFSCEGDVSQSKQYNNPSYRIHACTVSKEFSQDMSLLLKKFGILANLQVIKRKKDNHNTIYRIGMGGCMYNRFMDVIGVMERKSNSQRNKGKDYLVYVGDYVLSKVKEVDHTEVVQPVYDFTTTSHTFIANGVLTHNCHHSKAETWYNSLSLCENAVYRIGLTGTVDKKDKIGWMRLQALFADVIVRVSNDYLINRGVSSKPIIRLIPIREPRNIELINNYLEAYRLGIVENEERNNTIVKLVEAYKKRRPGGILISVREIEHGNRILEKLKEKGYDAEFIHGNSDSEHREKMLKKFSKGELDILIGSTIIDEGVDVRSIGCVILAAGGKSMRQLLQRLGRGLRLNGIEGNSVMVFDFMDLTNKFLKNHSIERINIFKEEKLDVKVLGQ